METTSSKIRQNQIIMDNFRSHRNQRPERLDRFEVAQLAILNVIQALRGLVSPDKVYRAVRDAKSENGVSLAIRNNLPKKIKF